MRIRSNFKESDISIVSDVLFNNTKGIRHTLLIQKLEEKGMKNAANVILFLEANGTLARCGKNNRSLRFAFYTN